MTLPSEAEMASLSAPQLIALVQSLTATIQSIQHRLDWFERNLFGTKSERLRVLDNDQQLSLGEVVSPPEREEPPKERQVAGYTRRVTQDDAGAEDAESVPFFDESCVPVETIELRAAELEGLEAGEFEVIGQKLTHRLAQRPGSYVILKYVRPVLKRRATQTIHCPPAPPGVIEPPRACPQSHPDGAQNWNFCWTELGTKHVGIVQSLIVTCRLHGIDVYTYLVDVLQRISEHPASRVAELTPRLWKRHFAAKPLRSALHHLAA